MTLLSPSKADVLLRSDRKNWKFNAYVGRGDDYAIARGFGIGAKVLAEAILSRGVEDHEIHFLVYPLMYQYRHYVELAFKRLIGLGRFVMEIQLTEKQSKRLQGHELEPLWQTRADRN